MLDTIFVHWLYLEVVDMSCQYPLLFQGLTCRADEI
ncbi:hypothetical protein PMIT1312_00255 [Prochlorococcus marinus str. MIT 1312]|nr:hypothetical protein PMIT1312_00255 [Prochlorococcus marinus str. MIT 1312]